MVIIMMMMIMMVVMMVLGLLIGVEYGFLLPVMIIIHHVWMMRLLLVVLLNILVMVVILVRWHCAAVATGLSRYNGGGFLRRRHAWCHPKRMQQFRTSIFDIHSLTVSGHHNTLMRIDSAIHTAHHSTRRMNRIRRIDLITAIIRAAVSRAQESTRLASYIEILD